MASRLDIAIIGPGKVGTALGVLCARAGLNVVAIGGGRRNLAQAAARTIGNSVRVLATDEAASAANLVLLTVPDDAIELVCRQLAQAGAVGPDTIVAHCCGALGSEVLSTAASCGAQVGSMHPLQTFPTVESALASLPGTYCFIEGTEQACTALESLARAIGAQPMRMNGPAKALYHAAAATACNFLVTLLDSAGAMFSLALKESAGADRRSALVALAPLVQATLNNVLQIGPEHALTGPIARGDIKTVHRHLEAIGQATPELTGMYRELGLLTVELALRRNNITAEMAQQLRQLLLNNPNSRMQ